MQKEFLENNIMRLKMDKTFQFPHVLLHPHFKSAKPFLLVMNSIMVPRS